MIVPNFIGALCRLINSFDWVSLQMWSQYQFNVFKCSSSECHIAGGMKQEKVFRLTYSKPIHQSRLKEENQHRQSQ